MGRWTRRHRRACQLAVSLLILALLPTPWPKVEFHNVRHHDSPGQVCEYHDHLVRWHPDASGAEDVAILHWHWAWPSPTPDEPDHQGAGLRLHAFLGIDALPAPDAGPAIVADPSTRLITPPVVAPPSLAFAFDLPAHLLHALRTGTPPALPFSATFAPRTSLTSRLHRWSC